MKVVTLINKGKVQTISLDDLKNYKIELTQSWENLCRKCGKCCFTKSINQRGIVYINYDKPCENLKFVGKKAECGIYHDRFTKCDLCQTIPEAVHDKGLPADCPYVKSVSCYKAPVDNAGWYKAAKQRMVKNEMYSGGDQPTGGTRDAYAKPPHREDLVKPEEWKRRRLQSKLRRQGKIGALDPREKTTYNIKPSGHQLGG